jgi:hypothetical protein
VVTGIFQPVTNLSKSDEREKGMRVPNSIKSKAHVVLSAISASLYRIICQAAVVLIVTILFANMSPFMAQSEPQPVPLPTASSALTSGGSSGLTTSGGSTAKTDNTQTGIELPGAVSAGCVTHSSPTKLAFFYNPPENTSTTVMANNFDSFVYTRNFESEVDALSNKGVYPVMQYLKYDAVHDPCFQAKKAQGTACSCSKKPLNNNVGWNQTDICTIRDEHPDWFLRDKNGALIYFNEMVMMDPGNQGWRDFWISRIQISQAEAQWDGVFLDNLATEFGAHHGDTDIVLQKYTDDQYRAAVTGFHKYVTDNYFKPNNRLYMANVAVYWGQNDVWFQYTQHMDGGQDEFWALTRDGYYSLLSWEYRLLRWEESIKRGDRVILVTQGTKGNTERQRFGFASYLLLAGPNVTFRYADDNAYGEPWLYDNYNYKLGNPTGAYVRKENDNGQTVFVRKFQNGKVKVNPEAKKAKIKVYDPDGTVCT